MLVNNLSELLSEPEVDVMTKLIMANRKFENDDVSFESRVDDLAVLEQLQ